MCVLHKSLIKYVFYFRYGSGILSLGFGVMTLGYFWASFERPFVWLYYADLFLATLQYTLNINKNYK